MLPKKTHSTKSAAETKEVGYQLGLSLKEGDVVLLEGALGAGKTTLIKGIGKAFGVEEELITSPTFVLMHFYTDYLVHFDLYRLQDLEEFTRAGLQEYLESPYIALIEWPAIVKPVLHSSCYELKLSHKGEVEREITIL